MHKQHQDNLLDEIGGEALNGSGFEAETPDFENDGEFASTLEEQEDEQ